ncbi:MAG: Hpt domain-containing protein [Candidatus Marinimicrobia bacterium]|nr:Hpt domain-containing protein [Candidatus Neomarinimicrobiota bacterium]MCF7850363.1 Hpt domain-containing protein [Candidatus Neomarinimicrobiota bacterium]MCF7904488.1 Hpt domain-containing protein [Candidatus Neomarinimicrobiota bacterium]
MRRIHHDMKDDSIDEDVLLRLHKMGGAELVSGLIALYFKNAPEKLDTIYTGLKNGDSESIERAAHTMISSAGNLGGKLVSDLAKKIEAAAMENDLKEIEDLVGPFDQANTSFYNYLKEYEGAS